MDVIQCSLIMQDDLDCQEVSMDEDDETPNENIKSTKQPLQVGKKPKKHQKLECAENALLEKAITCVEQATIHSEETLDSAELFGRYIASELKVLNTQSQRWVKLQIQNMLYNAALSETSLSIS